MEGQPTTLSHGLRDILVGKKNDSYCKLMKLAEMDDQQLTDDQCMNVNLALARAFRYGSAEEIAQAISYHTQFLHAKDQLCEIS